ncbi:MAG: helix-turn-helix domain-containing protein [Candidatus Hodarchaeales archaeon]
MKKYVSELQYHKGIKEFEITYKSSSVYWTRVIHHLDYPSIYETVLECNCMTILPINIESGVQYHSIISPNQMILKKLLQILKNRFSSVKITKISTTPYPHQKQLLTTKQLEAFKLAYKSGYYEIPRKIYIRQLSKEIGIKQVAFQERIRRAEKRIIDDFARQNGLI